MTEERKIFRRKEYQEPEYLVEHAHLDFVIFDENKVEVISKLQLKNNASGEPIILNVGTEIKEISFIKIDGVEIAKSEWKQSDKILELAAKEGVFILEIKTVLDPQNNKTGQGLYESRGVLVTQNEATGFRNITVYPDRPDVMSTWSTKVTAPKDKYPTLLATGDLTNFRENEDGTHTAEFHSDFKMPAYLYCLVAGKFDCLEDEVVMPWDEKPVKLQIYAPPGKGDRTKIAMESLKTVMKWDYENFGRKYPLRDYKIVAVDDFNAGAMENFGLNVFSAGYVLGDPRVATDDNILGVAHTVEHEYCHTWRGDLVTVRSWHEIALKEGFVSLMDRLFNQFLLGKTSGRIGSVRGLRANQFAEDASATAHAVWPEEYEGDPSNSMYTSTTYSKGAEVIGMAKMLLGDEKFRAGSDRYFNDFFGKAATIEDLVISIQKACEVDLTLFKNWFFQVGTPRCDVSSKYDEAAKTFSLTVKQECVRDPRLVLHFPLTMGLISAGGEKVELELEGEVNELHDLSRGVLSISKPEETFVFKNVPMGTVPSLLREFSAPVTLNYDYSHDELLLLMKHDEDGFNRFEAGQRISRQELKKLVDQYQAGETTPEAGKAMVVSEEILDAYASILMDLVEKDPTLAADMLVLPSESELLQGMAEYDFDAAKAARDTLKMTIARKFKMKFGALYSQYHDFALAAEKKPGVSLLNIDAIKLRKIKNVCLAYLAKSGENGADAEAIELIKKQFAEATNMTDEFVALSLLSDIPSEREEALKIFKDKWHAEELVMNKWLRVQAMIDDKQVTERVRQLMASEDFNFDQQSGVYSLLIYGFAQNSIYFHDKSGSGYELAAEAVMKLNNPDVASRLVREAFSDMPKVSKVRQDLMKKALEKIVAEVKLEGPRLMAKKILG
ncbi:MAG: aminopeptidase N [Patescibacteria group bacterium]